MAFIALFYVRGACGISRDYSKKLLSLRFNIRSTRSFHLQTDKFALVPNVWNRFVVNCISCYKPGANIKIDEQIFPTKSRGRFKHENPDKFGIKFL